MKKHSLTRQITSIVSLLVAGAILLCWVLNTTLLPRYYMHNKKEVLMENYQTISNASAQNELESDEFAVTFDNLCSNGNIMALILQQDGKVLRSSVNDLDALRTEFWDVLLHGDKMEVLYSNKQYQLLQKTDTRLDSEYLVLVGVLENGDMVLMRTAVESIRESAAISNRFLLFAGAAAIVASILVAFFTTRHITKPLQQLTDISKRMVDLDFNAKYETDQSNSYEVEELGNHINRLSENLERTISELKTANVELQDDIEKKIQIDEMRKEFLSNVSHELKTPLALIQGYAEGLQECINDDAESREFYCEVIIDEADKMNRMVKKLLTLNQLEFGNDQVIMERFDMTELIRGVANSTRILMEQKGIRLELENSEEAWVWGDEFKVEEVITNYMSNAINHADGDKRIDIQLEKKEKTVKITVHNTGEQIPEEDLSKLWDKFYKVDKARTREYGGSGVGLSIVKASMEQLGQPYGVYNCEDGVSFWFELDCQDAAEMIQEQA